MTTYTSTLRWLHETIFPLHQCYKVIIWLCSLYCAPHCVIYTLLQRPEIIFEIWNCTFDLIWSHGLGIYMFNIQQPLFMITLNHTFQNGGTSDIQCIQWMLGSYSYLFIFHKFLFLNFSFLAYPPPSSDANWQSYQILLQPC